MDQELAEIKKQFKENPQDEAIQVKYCRIADRLGLTKNRSICRVPWCQTKVGAQWRTKTFCAKHGKKRLFYLKCLSVEESPEVFLPNYLSSYIDYDYEYERNCDDFTCNGICRCGRIVDLEFNSQRTNELIADTLLIQDYDPVTQYCIDRIIRRSLSPCLEDNWEAEIGPGYYGEEIESIIFSNKKYILTRLNNMIRQKNDKEKIFFILRMEYGVILPRLHDYNFWSVKQIPINKIVKNDMHVTDPETVNDYHKIESKYLETDVWHYGRGIYLEEAPEDNLAEVRFRLIDGYHRLASAIKNKSCNIWAVVGKK